MKITIETDGATAQALLPSNEASAPVPSAAERPVSAAATTPSVSALLEKAAAMGALNAGPAPSLAGGMIGPTLIIASAAGEGALIPTSSAGAASTNI